RDRASADKLVEDAATADLRIETIRGDLTHPEKFKAVVDEIKTKTDRVDALVHCAASGVHRKAVELTQKHLTWTFEINVFAIHTLIQSLIEMIPAGGRIVGVTSTG